MNDNIYPEYIDKFNTDICNHFEFDIPIIKEQSVCNMGFKLAPYQIFLKNFISDTTPYNSILLYHGTGTGKTCSAVSIAENFRDIYYRKDKRIIILSPGGVKQGWLNNIYDPKKEAEQCTGDTFINIKNNKENVESMQKKLIKKYYKFYGYLEFANRIRDIYDDECKIESGGYIINIPIYKLKLTKDNRDNIIKIGSNVKWSINKIEYSGKIISIKNKSKDFKKICDKVYSNRVLIIDEAHRIRGNDKSDDDIKYIRLLLEHTKNLKLILLSATPMYNEADEISDLINLLLTNDNRENIDIKNIFKDKKLINEKLLEEQIIGYISYIKGETSNKFPKKLFPIENIIKIGEFPIYECKMKDYQEKQYNKIYKGVKDKKRLDMDTILKQCSNIIYPNTNKNYNKYYGKGGLDEIFNIDINKYKYKKDKIKIFKKENIYKYSSKIDALLKNLEKSEGVVFIYSQYIQSGIIPIMLALEQNGYSNYSDNILSDDDKSKNNGFKYISITTDKSISKNNDKMIQICVSPENINGEKIKIILGSDVASEGLDLKYIRQIHIFDPWYHFKKIQQIIGRGIRYCSHMELPEEKRNTTVYIYGSTLDNNDKSIDIQIYNIADKKNNEIVKVEKILQNNAIDKKLFKEINVNKVSKCKKTKKNMNTLTKESLKNMYNTYEYYIKILYNDKIIYNIADIIKYLSKFSDNINKDLLYLTLKNMVKTKKQIKHRGNLGYLIYINNNYIYQPNNKIDNYISIYERNNKNTISKKYTPLTIKTQNKKVKNITIKSVLNKLEMIIKGLDKEIFKYINDIDIKIKYDFSIEKLDVAEKRILIEQCIENKLNEKDLIEIVFEHFKDNIIYEDYHFNKTSNKIGYILFEIDNKKDKPLYIIKQHDKYIEVGDLTIKKIKNNLKNEKLNKDIKLQPYFIYNYWSKAGTKLKPVFKIRILEQDKKLNCQSSSGLKQTIKEEFKKYNKVIYEKNKEILDKYNDKVKKDGDITQPEFCDIIEILFRIETQKGNKIHFNYDEFQLIELNNKI